MITWNEKKESEVIEGECPHLTKTKRNKKSEPCKNCKRVKENCSKWFKVTGIGFVISCVGSEF